MRRLDTAGAVICLWLAWMMSGCAASLPFLASPRPLTQSSDVRVEKNRAGEWVLLVDGRPFFVQGVSYTVSRVGQSPEEGFDWMDWAYSDDDKNGRSDGPYDAWVDANRNNRQDDDEPAVGDFKLMQEMGVNTIRWYHNAYPGWLTNKHVLRDLAMSYGIRVAVGDLFGAYAIGSGASTVAGTDYRNPLQRQRMLESVTHMVQEHKDEPYLLVWLLGYENTWYQTNTNAAKYPEVYAKFVNEAAALIHRLDGRHPVALVNGDMGFLKMYAQWAPEIDIFGVNAYRGPDGFGVLWDGVRRVFDRPILITEYGGAEARGVDEDFQAVYHRGCWLDIVKNRAGGSGAGNAVGGIAFEWLDRWWAAGDPYRHAPLGAHGHAGRYDVPWEAEYAGICSQGDGRHSPFLRQLRKVYRVYQQELWGARPPTLTTRESR